MVDRAVPRQSKQELAYTWIQDRIKDGTYRAGHPLVMASLASEMGVSAVPVREAMRRLEAEGWVTYQPHTGAQVADAASGQAYESVLSVVAVLEGFATATAAPNVTAEDLDRLRSLNSEMGEALQNLDIEQYIALNREFHNTIYNRGDNAYLLEMLRSTRSRLDSLIGSLFHVVPQRARESLAEHADIIALLASNASLEDLEVIGRRHEELNIQAYKNKRMQGQSPR
ncbi:GntR family transcriptional regulator [Paenarthrobacter nicotinovorans]|uniref:GntR family transcriptional regulator n=1 Tax=Paenarthrobacter nicotinovorans TaxID=29320 RepID=UPI003825598D